MVTKSSIRMTLTWKVKGSYHVIRGRRCFLASQSLVAFVAALSIGALKFLTSTYTVCFPLKIQKRIKIFDHKHDQ